MLRSHKDLKETKYLEYLNNNTNKDDKTIKSKINEIRKTIAELDVLLDKKYKKEILKYLDKIDRKTKITPANKTNILNRLSEISLDLQYKRKHMDSAYDDSNYYGLKDL